MLPLANEKHRSDRYENCITAPGESVGRVNAGGVSLAGHGCQPDIGATISSGGQHPYGNCSDGPLPARLLARLEQTQALIVEADITFSPPLTHAGEAQTPLADRLSAAHYDHVRQLSKEYHFDLAALDALPAWHVALLLQSRQAERLGLRADYGIDYQLIQAARANDQPIIELEGPEEQLGLLRKLPDHGAALLADTLTHWHTNARLLQVMIGWWLESRPVDVRQAFPSTFRMRHSVLTAPEERPFCQS